ncbi:carbohydrate ABC transporter permease [Clostridium thermarum]|uniref:carbohydrate ABC transporter permease n=1 Tax=Clostridium thermarum TaxID=1716543 RepID=UPI0013D2A040|nr:sugar ABC transporter permease [Clostridium thermarum]
MKSKMTIKRRKAVLGYSFVLPWIIGFLLLTAFPFFYSVYLSLSSVKISPTGIQTTWVGLKNYFDIFTKDVNFSKILIESVVFVVLSTPMIVVASLIVAMLLNGKFRGRAFFRAIFFLPVIIISGPVMSELMTNQAAQIVDPSNYIIYRFFMTLPSAVSAPVLYIFDNLVLILWFSGVQIIIFLAGLQKIDTSIYEAASIDGASSWQVFWKIVLPFLKPLALVNAIYTIVEMAAFPTNKINTTITDKMFEMGNVYSTSAAMSWIYFMVEFLLLGLVFLILKEKQKKEGAK